MNAVPFIRLMLVSALLIAPGRESRAAAAAPAGSAGAVGTQWEILSCEHVEEISMRPGGDIRLDDEYENVYMGARFTDPRSAVLDQAKLRRVVQYLVCAGARVNQGYFAGTAVDLFMSKRYGAKAFRILREEAKAGGKYAKDAAELSDQMHAVIQALRDHRAGRD